MLPAIDYYLLSSMWDPKPDRASVPPACPELNSLKPVCKGLFIVKIRTKSILPLICFQLTASLSRHLSLPKLSHVCPSFSYTHIPLLLSPPNPSRVLLGTLRSATSEVDEQVSQHQGVCSLKEFTLVIDPSCASQSSIVRNYSI